MLSKRYGPIKHARQIIALSFGSRISPMIMDYFRTMEIFAFRRYVSRKYTVILPFYLGVAIKWPRGIAPPPSVCKPLAAGGWGLIDANDGFPALHQRASIYLCPLLSYMFSLRLVYLFISFLRIYFHHFRARFLAKKCMRCSRLSNIYTWFFTRNSNSQKIIGKNLYIMYV